MMRKPRADNWFDQMKHQQDNPPKPFNPEYRHYAAKLYQETTESLRAEGWYEDFTLAQRQASGEWRERYNTLKVKYETEYAQRKQALQKHKVSKTH